MRRAIAARAVGGAVIAAAFAYPVVVWWLGRAVEGYSHVTQQISELGVDGVPLAWVLNGVLVIDGALVMALAWALRGPWLVGVLGATLIVGGLFPCDAGCRPVSFAGWVHVVNGVPALVATLVAPFLLARRLAGDPRMMDLGRITRVVAVVMVVAVIGAFATGALGFGGLGQRAVLALQLGFLGLAGLAAVRAI